MITALVHFAVPEAITAEAMAELSEASAPLYKGREGLIRKYYVRSPEGTEVGGVYLWESRDDGEQCYDDEWFDRVTEVYGVEPMITWLETPVVVDNLHDEIIID